MLEIIKKITERINILLDSSEIIIASIFATILFFSVPFHLVKDIYKSGHTFLAIVLIVGIVFSFCICVRDIKRKKWTILSICTAIFWCICLLITGWILMF